MRVLQYFTIVTVFLNCLPEVCCEVKEVSACHGTQKAECDFFELSCDPDQRIRLLSQEYGYKDYKCETKKKKCMNDGGCCVYNADDCTEPYTKLHIYDLMRACSRKRQCGPLQSPNNILTTCGNNASTYVHLQYDCFRDDTVMNICDDTQGIGTEMSIVFDQATNNRTEPTTCVCETMVLNGDEVELDYIDVRMMRAHSETGSGSLCSSAILRGEGDDIQLGCDENISEEDNLVNNIVGRVNLTDTGQLKIVLENLFATGANDSPVMVWLYLRAVSGELRTRCFREAPLPPTSSSQSTVATKPVTGTHNNSGQNTDLEIGGDDGNIAVIVGVLIPVLVVAILAVVVFVVWRRKRRPLKRRTVVQNNYNDSISSMNSAAVISAEYDEIRDGVEAHRPPLYDPVYELARETSHEYQNGTAESEKQQGNIKKNQPTYQNIKGNKQSTEHKSSKSDYKSTKLPFGDFRTKKDQLLSFFKGKQDNLAPPTIQKKPSDASISSYDHLNAYNPEVQLQVTPPPEETANPYAHTNTNASDKLTNSTKSSEAQNTHSLEGIKRSASPKGVKAVEVGDSYIEFQFGTLDEDVPDLFMSKAKADEVQNTNAKLMKPNRPPPKPGSPKLGNANVVENVPKASAPTKQPKEVVSDQQTYDYAEENIRLSVASGANKTSVIGECRTDSEGGAMDYSYADVDSDETQIKDSLTPDQIYEDVDDSAEPNIRKCSSAQDLSCDSLGGYEVPVKSQSTRPTSVPSKVQRQQKPKSAVSGLEAVVNEVTSPVGLGHVVKELKEIQDLPDLSDPSSLPNELKYANLGLHTPKAKQNVAKKENDTVKDSATARENESKPGKDKDTRLKSESKEIVKNEEPAIRKGVLSLAKKFETQK